MLDINKTTAKRLVLESGYDSVYTEEVRTNGGNSAKINCKKEHIGKEVMVFVLENNLKKRERRSK